MVGVGVGLLVYRGADIARSPSASPRSAPASGVEPPDDNGKVETALSLPRGGHRRGRDHAVCESSAESVRLRRSLDALPLGLVLCDEAGGVIFRNTQAETLMASRYGDAIAAQAVTDILAEGWVNGVAERTIDIYGPPRRTLTIRATRDRRRAPAARACSRSSRTSRSDVASRTSAATSSPTCSHELKTPMGALGLLAETLQFERDPAVANRLAERINSEAFRVNRIIEDLLDLSRIEGEGSPTREPLPGVARRRRRHRADPHRGRAARRDAHLRRARGQLSSSSATGAN